MPFAEADRYFRQAGPQAADTLPFLLIAAVTSFQAGRMDEGAALPLRGLQADAACIVWFDRAPAFTPFRNEPAVRGAQARARRP